MIHVVRVGRLLDVVDPAVAAAALVRRRRVEERAELVLVARDGRRDGGDVLHLPLVASLHIPNHLARSEGHRRAGGARSVVLRLDDMGRWDIADQFASFAKLGYLLPFLPLENCVYKGVINDCVIMQAIMRTNTRFGQD